VLVHFIEHFEFASFIAHMRKSICPSFSARTHFSQKHSVHCRPTLVMHQLVALRTLRIVKETAHKQTLMKRTDEQAQIKVRTRYKRKFTQAFRQYYYL